MLIIKRFFVILVAIIFSTAVYAYEGPTGVHVGFGDEVSILPTYDDDNLYYQHPMDLRRKRALEREREIRQLEEEYREETRQRIEELSEFCAGDVDNFEDRALCQNLEQQQQFGMPLDPEDWDVIEPYPMPEPYPIDDHYTPPVYDDYYDDYYYDDYNDDWDFYNEY